MTSGTTVVNQKNNVSFDSMEIKRWYNEHSYSYS